VGNRTECELGSLTRILTVLQYRLQTVETKAKLKGRKEAKIRGGGGFCSKPSPCKVIWAQNRAGLDNMTNKAAKTKQQERGEEGTQPGPVSCQNLAAKER
jgi:hypothetical protein